MKKFTIFFRLGITLMFVTLTAIAISVQAQGLVIPNVPDQQQPIPGSITNPTTSACSPVSASNIVEYYESVILHSNAVGLIPGITPRNVSDYLYYFMDTGNWGSPVRANGTILPAVTGTYATDIQPGFYEYVRWDIQFLFGTFPPPPPSPPPPPPTLLPGKIGYNWAFATDYNVGWPLHVFEIDNERPNILTFSHWNPIPTGVSWMDPSSGEMIDFYNWGPFVPSGNGEDWNNLEADASMGHAVTGVGYLMNFTPDQFVISAQNWFICHDNWTTTTRNVALPWAYWKATITADPGPNISLAVELVDFTVTSKYATAILNWETASEQNSSHFEIERLIDQEKGFEVVAIMPAQGTSTTSTKYQYTEDLAYVKTIYYRLRQISENGEDQYSSIRSVTGLDFASEWTIFPNPVTDHLSIIAEVDWEGTVLIDILSQEGAVVRKFKTILNPGHSLIRLDRFADLSPGVYYVRIFVGDNQNVKKFIKVE